MRVLSHNGAIFPIYGMIPIFIRLLRILLTVNDQNHFSNSLHQLIGVQLFLIACIVAVSNFIGFYCN